MDGVPYPNDSSAEESGDVPEVVAAAAEVPEIEGPTPVPEIPEAEAEEADIGSHTARPGPSMSSATSNRTDSESTDAEPAVGTIDANEAGSGHEEYEGNGIAAVSPLQDRFSDSQDMEQWYEKAMYEFGQTPSGREFLDGLPEGVTLRDLVEHEAEHDVLTRVAALAEDAQIKPAQEGTIVHRISELRTLYHHPEEILSGTRLTEQRINYEDDFGERHAVELDTVIQRGDKHYIRDNKPLNLQTFEETEAGQSWSNWMESEYGADYRDQIRAGSLNPMSRGQTSEAAPGVREALRQYLDDTTQKHIEQLERYQAAYAQARGIDPGQVTSVIRPYFVYR